MSGGMPGSERLSDHAKGGSRNSQIYIYHSGWLLAARLCLLAEPLKPPIPEHFAAAFRLSTVGLTLVDIHSGYSLYLTCSAPPKATVAVKTMVLLIDLRNSHASCRRSQCMII